jgi:hypothetical protein
MTGYFSRLWGLRRNEDKMNALDDVASIICLALRAGELRGGQRVVGRLGAGGKRRRARRYERAVGRFGQGLAASAVLQHTFPTFVC